MTHTLSTQSASRPSVNWRGIILYLAICFGLTWGAEISALALGVRFVVLTKTTVNLLALVMFIPAASAFIVRRWLTREGFASTGLRLGGWKPYLFVLIGVPCLFFRNLRSHLRFSTRRIHYRSCSSFKVTPSPATGKEDPFRSSVDRLGLLY